MARYVRTKGELMNAPTGERIERFGLGMLRYGLIAIIVVFGAAKWTHGEAEAIQPWVANSPFMSWLYSVTTLQGASIAIGVVELVVAGLLGLRRWFPLATAIGSAMAIGMFLTTLSFLVTTPNVGPEAGFLLKDFFLLGIAVWSLGEALDARRR
jgi:uncharacterized membrane protein YkgB